MCSGVSGRCATADVEPQSWWVRYTSIPPRAQMAADGASSPTPRGDSHRCFGWAAWLPNVDRVRAGGDRGWLDDIYEVPLLLVLVLKQIQKDPVLVRHEKTVRCSAKKSGGPINGGNTQGLPSRDRYAVGQLEVSCTPTVGVDRDGLAAHFASLTAVTDHEPHLRAATH